MKNMKSSEHTWVKSVLYGKNQGHFLILLTLLSFLQEIMRYKDQQKGQSISYGRLAPDATNSSPCGWIHLTSKENQGCYTDVD